MTNLVEEKTMWLELLDIASSELVPLLVHARAGGMQVKRYGSGLKRGMLYISMSEKQGGDYSRWAPLNCGPGLKMYQHAQGISKQRWDAAHARPKSSFQINYSEGQSHGAQEGNQSADCFPSFQNHEGRSFR